MTDLLNATEKKILKALETADELFDTTPAVSLDEAAAFHQAVASAKNFLVLRHVTRENERLYPPPPAEIGPSETPLVTPETTAEWREGAEDDA